MQRPTDLGTRDPHGTSGNEPGEWIRGRFRKVNAPADAQSIGIDCYLGWIAKYAAPAREISANACIGEINCPFGAETGIKMRTLIDYRPRKEECVPAAIEKCAASKIEPTPNVAACQIDDTLRGKTAR
jgi:hypothetical protein